MELRKLDRLCGKPPSERNLKPLRMAKKIEKENNQKANNMP